MNKCIRPLSASGGVNTNPRRALFILTACALPTALLIAGCGGSGSHDVPTDYDGSVLGVATDPADAEEGVDTHSTVRVSWPDHDYPPPANFTFRLDRDDGPYTWRPVYTEMTTGPESRTWRFKPTSYLVTGKWYRVTITDDAGRKEYVFFRTRGTPDPTSARPLSSAEPKGAAEHRVRTR